MQSKNWCNRTLITAPYFALYLDVDSFYKDFDSLADKEAGRPAWINHGADATTHHLAKDGKIVCMVCLDGRKTKEHTPTEVVGLLVHEAVHIFQEHCASQGEKNPSSEYEAYSIQYIVQELIAKYDELSDSSVSSKPAPQETSKRRGRPPGSKNKRKTKRK